MAPSSKRKWNEVDDDDDEPSLGRQVLPVANLPRDFDGVPEDGLQYLFTVRRDAELLPRTTRVPNPYEIQEKPASPVRGGETVSVAQGYIPSQEWQDTFLRHFKYFRQNRLQPTNQPPTPGHSGKVVPDKKDRDAWWAFVSGEPDAIWNPPKKPKVAKTLKPRGSRGMRGFSEDIPYDDVQVATTSSQTWSVNDVGEVELVKIEQTSPEVPAFNAATEDPRTESPLGPADSTPTTAKVMQREPTPSLLRGIDHRYSLHLLMYFTHWINLRLEQPHPRVSNITETHARWMFSLLSRVEDYVSADEMSLLRSLARACMALLKERLQHRLAEDPSDLDDRIISESSCWMIIIAVIGLWAQRDLWMDVESMLSEIQPRVS
ncbi:hypothetical protein QCA50_000403 [Cerrena zonata]|uniref:Uncharacterized protein n=1 Tax=Cerrena zonata TaxID=2478898 RepID=A0AAW0GQK1_9APHY